MLKYGVLTTLTLTLAMTQLAACGKKISEPETTGARSTPAISLPSDFSLEVEAFNINNKTTTYALVRDGAFVLPNKLFVQSGNGSGGEIKIYFNYIEQEDYEFHCIWKPSGLPSELEFERCENIDNRDLGITPATLSLYEFPIDQGKKLILEFSKLPIVLPTKVQSTFTVDWK